MAELRGGQMPSREPCTTVWVWSNDYSRGRLHRKPQYLAHVTTLGKDEYLGCPHVCNVTHSVCVDTDTWELGSGIERDRSDTQRGGLSHFF